MMRLILVALFVVIALAVSACSAPSNNPCLYDGGLVSSHLSYNGKTLVVVCKDGKIVTRHP